MKPIGRAALVLVLFLQLTGVFGHSLWTPDEPREAQITREMADTGECLIPSLAGRPFLEKPPLYYLVAVASCRLFGRHFQEAGRVASLLFAFGTLLTVFFTARRLYSDETAALSVLVLATFVRFFESSHKILVDVGLVFFITAGMCAFILAYRGMLRWGYPVFWIMIGLAFMTKGIIGLAIPGAGILIFMVWQRDAGIIAKSGAAWGIPLTMCFMAVWGWILYARGGYDFLYTFYIYNQFGRFMPGTIYHGGHVRPLYYYLTSVPVDALPWSILLVPAFIRTRAPGGTEKFLYSWFLGGLVLLSIASTKRGIYFLPMYPAMAVIIGRWISMWKPEGSRTWERALLWLVTALILTCSVALPVGFVAAGGAWWAALGIGIVNAGVFLFVWRRCGRSLPYFAVVGWALTLVLWTPAAFSQIDQLKSYKQLFIDLGEAVSHHKVIGYRLTETIEALGPFYGGFPVENYTEDDKFIRAINNREADYIIVLPGRLDAGLKREITSMASLLMRVGGDAKREIELWMVNPSR